MRCDFTVHEVRWRAPLVSAHDRAAVSPQSPPRPLILLRLESADGTVGHGEAAPLESYDGVSVEQVLAALEAYRPVLAGVAEPHATRDEILADCAKLAPLPQALAAVDLALWDMAGHRVGQPVWWLFGDAEAPRVELNATIGAEAPDAAAAEAIAAREAGFRCVKVKVGIRGNGNGSHEDGVVGGDRDRVGAVREALGPGVGIRLDANGAWSVEQAIAMLTDLAPLEIECCEEPVHGVDATSQVYGEVKMAVAIDESAADPGVFERRAADAVCLKISRCGGISGVIRDATRARAAGYEVYLASTLDGPLGIAAALHAAAIVNPDRPCGLATLDRFAQAPPFAAGATASPPTGPGLGTGLAEWYI
jgi:L-Ala-D/L-Glu epimerase